jgi:hypothetical protein
LGTARRCIRRKLRSHRSMRSRVGSNHLRRSLREVSSPGPCNRWRDNKPIDTPARKPSRAPIHSIKGVDTTPVMSGSQNKTRTNGARGSQSRTASRPEPDRHAKQEHPRGIQRLSPAVSNRVRVREQRPPFSNRRANLLAGWRERSNNTHGRSAATTVSFGIH